MFDVEVCPDNGVKSVSIRSSEKAAGGFLVINKCKAIQRVMVYTYHYEMMFPNHTAGGSGQAGAAGDPLFLSSQAASPTLASSYQGGSTTTSSSSMSGNSLQQTPKGGGGGEDGLKKKENDFHFFAYYGESVHFGWPFPFTYPSRTVRNRLRFTPQEDSQHSSDCLGRSLVHAIELSPRSD